MLEALRGIANVKGGLTIFLENEGEDVLEQLASCQNNQVSKPAQALLGQMKNGDQIEIDQEGIVTESQFA